MLTNTQHPTETDRAKRNTRTCVGCRASDSPDALVRFVVFEDDLAVDLQHKLPGRGFSLHPTKECTDRAISRGGLNRAVLSDKRWTPQQLRRLIIGAYERRLQGLIVSAYRARRLAVGNDAVRRGIAEKQGEILIVAKDASSRHNDARRIADRLGTQCVSLWSAETLGALVGRGSVATMLVTEHDLAHAIACAAQRVIALSEDG